MAESGFERVPDVLIVGAGASGAVAAKRLAEAQFDVVCLEQGDWPDYGRARASHADFELTSGRDWSWDPNLRRGPADYPVDGSESDITALMWNGVVGGTVVYAAHWQRNLPSDFRVRTLDGVAVTGRSRTRTLSPTTCGSSRTGASPAWPATQPFRKERDRRCPPHRDGRGLQDGDRTPSSGPPVGTFWGLR